MSAKELFLEFSEQINAHNVDGLCRLMSEDHSFIDALGATIKGREQMRHGWTSYFRMVPDYQITFTEVFEQGDTVAAFGTAQGTYSANGELRAQNQWQVPAAWLAKIKNDLIVEWRVYCDNEPIRKLMAPQASEE
ncbi:MAG TPA: nuclear transport factor 2 family protein [Pyrinomonadaceae bacterium]|nr:nuclear transport factor 2 family protein [Pyrinomonadaceae bacterium]